MHVRPRVETVRSYDVAPRIWFGVHFMAAKVKHVQGNSRILDLDSISGYKENTHPSITSTSKP